MFSLLNCQFSFVRNEQTISISIFSILNAFYINSQVIFKFPLIIFGNEPPDILNSFRSKALKYFIFWEMTQINEEFLFLSRNYEFLFFDYFLHNLRVLWQSVHKNVYFLGLWQIWNKILFNSIYF